MLPHIQYPGVYITEVASNPQPIEGVPTSIARLIGADVSAKIQQLVDQVPQDSTTGIALLELMAWIAENLIRRLDDMPDEANLAAERLAVIALALVKDRAPPHGSVLKRVRYFEGQLIEDELSSGIGSELKICVKKKAE